MIQWFDAVLNRLLFSAALQYVCFKHSCMMKKFMTFCSSLVVEFQFLQKVWGSILGQVKVFLQHLLTINLLTSFFIGL